MPVSVNKNWTRGILQALFIGSEMTWLLTLLIFIAACFGDNRPNTLAPVVLVYPFACAAARLSGFGGWTFRTQIGAGMAAAVATLCGLAFVLTPAPVLGAGGIKYWAAILLVGGFAFMRGGYAGLKRMDRLNFARSFQFGMLLMLLLIAISSLVHMGQATAVTLAVIFLTCGFAGLWLARVSDLSDKKGPLRSTWIVMVVVALAIFIAVSAAIILLFDHELLEQIVALIFWLGRQAVRALSWFFSLFPTSDQVEIPIKPPAIQGAQSAAEGKAMSEFFRNLTRTIGQIMFTMGWGAFFFMILYHNIMHLMRWLRKKMDPENAALYEATQIGFMDDVKALLGAIVRFAAFLWRGLKRLGIKLPGRKSPPEPAVAGIYRKLLAWGESKGLARALNQTPHEYLERLIGSFPEFERSFRAITDSFVSARYGRHISGSEEIESITNNWRSIKSKVRPGAAAGTMPLEQRR